MRALSLTNHAGKCLFLKADWNENNATAHHVKMCGRGQVTHEHTMGASRGTDDEILFCPYLVSKYRTEKYLEVGWVGTILQDPKHQEI